MNFNPSSIDNNTHLCYLLAFPSLKMMNLEFEHTAPGKRNIYEGKYDDICSVDDFLSHMPASEVLCQEVFREEDEDEDEVYTGFLKEVKYYPMQVFWYPSAVTVNNNTSKISASGRSVQEQIKCFLEGLKCFLVGLRCYNYVMVQYWIPRRSMSGRTVLTVSEQPFAMGRLYNGLCRYRYHCIQQQIDVSSNDAGPIGRVFNRGSTEFCVNIESYSEQEFPMRNYAKYCGIKQYAAFPISELGDDKQQCIGVLELVMETDVLYEAVCSIMVEDSTELRYTTSHARECYPVRSYLDESNLQGKLEICGIYLRESIKMPLIQIWAPCLCDTATRRTELFCHWADSDQTDLDSDYASLTSDYGTHSLNNGKGLVGKAYSQTKCCFFRDTSRFSMSDNPLVHNTRSFKLTACFAIPLQSIHPKFHPFILEVFLPPLENYDHGNLEALLKSILATVYVQLSKSDVAFGITEDEEFHVEFSNSDDENFVYFCVRRNCRPKRTGAVIGDEIEQNFSMAVKATCRGKTAKFPLTNDSVIEELHKELGKRFKLEDGRFDIKYKDEDGELISLSCNEDLQLLVKTLKASEQSTLKLEINTIEDVEITLEKINQYRGLITQEDAAQKLGVSLSTLKRRCRELHLKRWPFSKRKKVNGLHSSARLEKTKSVESYADAIENGGVSANENETGTNGKVSATRIDEIGLCVTNNARENEAASAKSIPVDTSGKSMARENDVIDQVGMRTIKRARENDATDANSASTGAIGKAVTTGNDKIGCCICNNAKENEAAAAKSTPLGIDGIDKGHSMINVMATYKDDTILFPLSCNSGIKELRMELDDAFQFGAEKFKVKYEHDDGIWITLLRDKDFRFHMDTLKASGQSTMKLSVFPITQ